MLHILAGRAGGGQTDTILTQVGASSSPCVLIVPEQWSHEAERALCRALPPAQSARCEVLSFTRLSRRVAEKVGGVADQMLDAGGRVLLMHKAVSQTVSHLSVYRTPSRKPAFLAGLAATVDECKSYRYLHQLHFHMGRCKVSAVFIFFLFIIIIIFLLLFFLN